MHTLSEGSGTVYIVGLDPTTRDRAFEDPDGGQEIWGLNQGHLLLSQWQLKQFTRWFQIHPWDPMIARQRLHRGKLFHEAWLRGCLIPVYLEKSNPDVPQGLVYPYEEVCLTLGGNYFAVNSIGYMLALAIHEKAAQIHLFGIDMGPGDAESYARPAIEFLLGYAMGQGVRIVMPEECCLLKGDLYGKSVAIPSDAFEMAMDGVREIASELPYGSYRRSLTALGDRLERAYQTEIQDKALTGERTGILAQECVP